MIRVAEAAQVVGAGEGGLQVEKRVAVIGREGQLELRQALLERRGVDLVAVGRGGARDRDRVVELGQTLARVGQRRLALQDEIDLNDAGALMDGFAARVEIGLAAGGGGLVRGADYFEERDELVVRAGADLDEFLGLLALVRGVIATFRNPLAISIDQTGQEDLVEARE